MASKYNKLLGKHVLIIGGSTGIGFAIAEASIASGANVTISSSSQDKLFQAVISLQSFVPASSQQKIQSFAANLSDSDAEANLEAVFEQSGPVDHVVFTAADSLSLMMLQDMTPEKILAACQMRLVAPLMAAKVAARHLAKSSESSFTITSGSAAHKSAPGWSVVSYFAAGLQGIVKQLAVELKPLRVNAVAPGYVDTGLWDGMKSEEKEEMVKGIEASMPTGKFGRVEDVAEAYLWLMKDRNVTGTVAATDSGIMIV
ncbi:short chain dehydrogenase [Colletotrichum graminicola]|uniref:Short chain dehydrogenase n=1 Tax=Colletotrichum graminicola (strain M1.001 / M2 / FGSC 10212) TaxID=645133 RepID=E3QPG9_COLGM|nr:short chain dehydrogenase [Colletotrichum graminicola M1.001]EFQ32757.1 short chain dehydrogenase [Colletotrichum graminicola M1.001]WDK18016.1 short chain dehydrogenase [Colletotrichum graminicola]